MASVARYCCCGTDCFNWGSPSQCSHCAHDHKYTITVSGSTVVAGCYSTKAGSPFSNVKIGSFGAAFGTYINGSALSSTPDTSCVHGGAIGGIEYKSFTDAACTIPFVGGTTSTSWSMYLTRSASDWTLEISDRSAPLGMIAFYDQQTASSGCSVVPAFTNQLTSGSVGTTHGPTGLQIVGHSGSATAVCQPS